MLSLNAIKTYYPESLRGKGQFLLREYLQYKILEAIYGSPYGPKLCFIGGTCLRIVHDNFRFSEDLNFDNLGLSQHDFEQVAAHVEKQLTRQGFVVEIRNVFKGAFHCHVKFSNILFEYGLSGHREEKIVIQLDAESQHFDYKPEVFIPNKFDVLNNILSTPIDILLAQKFSAICGRPRPKGRDFFDVTFLLAKTKPNYAYIEQKLGISNPVELKEKILETCKKINFEDVVEDVRSFLFDDKDEKRILLFEAYLKQVEL